MRIFIGHENDYQRINYRNARRNEDLYLLQIALKIEHCRKIYEHKASRIRITVPERFDFPEHREKSYQRLPVK